MPGRVRGRFDELDPAGGHERPPLGSGRPRRSRGRVPGACSARRPRRHPVLSTAAPGGAGDCPDAGTSATVSCVYCDVLSRGVGGAVPVMIINGVAVWCSAGRQRPEEEQQLLRRPRTLPTWSSAPSQHPLPETSGGGGPVPAVRDWIGLHNQTWKTPSLGANWAHRGSTFGREAYHIHPDPTVGLRGILQRTAKSTAVNGEELPTVPAEPARQHPVPHGPAQPRTLSGSVQRRPGGLVASL